MKNAFKFGFLAFAISLTVVACGGEKKAEGATDSTAKDTAAVTAPVDTTVKDTTVKDTTVKTTTTETAKPAAH